MNITVVRTLLRYCAWMRWPAAGVAAMFVVIGLAFQASGGLDRSMWETAGISLRAISLTIGAVATPVLLPLLVAHGITRRAFAVAASAVGALLAGAAGLYFGAGYLVERAIYTVGDLPQTLEVPHLFDSGGQLHLIVAEYALLSLGYLAGGWVVGIGYYGYGAWRGTACLLLGLLLVAGVEYALSTQFNRSEAALVDSASGLPLAAALALAVAVIGVGLVAGRALLHAVPIRTRRQP
jgi:hypothetical protein